MLKSISILVKSVMGKTKIYEMEKVFQTYACEHWHKYNVM